MKTSHPIRLFLSLLITCILAGACTFPVTTSDDFEVHFGRPAGGDVIMLGESLSLLANGSSTDGDVSRVLYFANGRLVSEAPNRAGDSIVAEYIWTPSEVGEYTLQLAAQRGSEYAYSPIITVCVLPFQIAPGHPYDIYAHGYEGDCEIPARADSAVLGEPRATTVSVSPESINYVPFSSISCPPQPRMLNFKFYIDDPHDDVVFASIALSIDPALTGRINGETTLALTHVGNEPPHTKLFVGEINMEVYLGRSLTTPETGEGNIGVINWLARAFGRDGAILIEEGSFTIPAAPVTCEGTSPLASPSPAATSTPILEQVSPTPASALDCPAGTYFSEFTNKCIAIEIPPTQKPGGESGQSCSNYASKDACTAGGCTWNDNMNKCQ